MKKESKKTKQCKEAIRYMGTYPGFVDYVGEMAKSIDLQCKSAKVLTPTGTNVMLNDLIQKYNSCTHIHFSDAFQSTFKSRSSDAQSKYMNWFKQVIRKAIEERYGCGVGFAGMSQADLVCTIEAFFAML